MNKTVKTESRNTPEIPGSNPIITQGYRTQKPKRGGVPPETKITPPKSQEGIATDKEGLEKGTLGGLSQDRLIKIAQANISEVIKKIKAKPQIFIFNYCWTLDPNDTLKPIKKMPKCAYLDKMMDIWVRERLLLIPKSRKMMMSWLMIELHLWFTMFFQGRYTFFVSKKEEDADELIERAKFVYDRLPKYLQVPMSRKYCYMKFEGIHSQIHAVSQDSDSLRNYTASAILSDEMAFQPYARKSYQGARPTIESGGKFTGVSSANGKEFFYNTMMDLE